MTPTRRARAVVLAALAVTAGAAGLRAQSVESRPALLRLVVPNPTPVPRDEIATFGVPVPRDATISDGTALSAVADGQPVPCSFRILSRHGGKQAPASWILVDLPVRVPPSGAAEVVLSVGASSVVPPPGLSASSGAAGPIVETGRLLASFPSEPAILARLGRSRGADDLAVELEMRDENDKPVSIGPFASAVEEATPLRVRIVSRAAGGGLRFTARTTLFSGDAHLLVDLRVENPGAYALFNGRAPAHVYLRSLGLVLRRSTSVCTVVLPDGTFAGAGAVTLAQTEAPVRRDLDHIDSLGFHIEVDGRSAVRGSVHSGSLCVDDSGAGIRLAVHRFWQNHPKALRIDAEGVHADIFPAFGSGPRFTGQYGSPADTAKEDPRSRRAYRFEGGRWKTHRLLLGVVPPGATPADATALAWRVNFPLAGLQDPGEAVATGAVPFLLAPRRLWNSDAGRRFERFFDILVDDSSADDQPGLGRIGLPALVRRGGTYGDNPHFGWFNYGDLGWADGFSSLHYDWPRSVLAGWIRTRDPRFLHVGSDMAWHRRDIDQDHSTDPEESFRGGQRYEKGWYHGNYQEPVLSHQWLGGLILHHLLTGDPGTLEAIAEGADYLHRRRPDLWDGKYGERLAGWPIENLVSLHLLTGDPRHAALARAVLARFEEIETREYGRRGYVLNAASAQPDRGVPAHASPWAHDLIFAAGARYVLATGDRSVVPLLERILAVLVSAVEPGSRTPSGYRPPSVPDRWTPDWTGGRSVHLVWARIFALAHAVRLSPRDDLRALGLRLFEDMARFHDRSLSSTGLDPADPSTWSRIAARMPMFPGTESKILGNLLYFGLPGLTLIDG